MSRGSRAPGIRDCVLITFLSYPTEASLTALLRGLEVCRCGEVLILSTRRRGREAGDLASRLGEALAGLGVRVEALPEVPDVDTAPEDIPKAVRWFREEVVRRVLKGRVACFTASSGSRLEVASASMALPRGSSDVIYVGFLWGPWRGAHYPHTPKPVQPAATIHCHDGTCSDMLEPPGTFRGVVDAVVRAVPLPPNMPRLREAVLEAQASINREACVALNPCVATQDLSRAGCPEPCGALRIVIRVGDAPPIVAEARDYCSWGDVLDAAAQVVEGCLRIEESGRFKRWEVSVATTIIDLAGFRQLTIEEVTGSVWCVGRGYALGEAIAGLPPGWTALLDTNVVYKGIHNQLLDYGPQATFKTAIPACALIELYEHRAQTAGRTPEEAALQKLRAGIAELVAEEAGTLISKVVREANAKPCEVGIALEAGSRRGIAPITADRPAYENLLKNTAEAAALTTPTPINKVKFKTNEKSRRTAYAYYAIAQLKALNNLLQPQLTKAKTKIQIRINPNK